MQHATFTVHLNYTYSLLLIDLIIYLYLFVVLAHFLDILSGMKLSMPVLSDRISPVFDESRRLLVVEIENGCEINRKEEPLKGMGPPWKALRLIELGVNVLICSAISWPLEKSLTTAGIQVVPHTCGPVEEILRAYITGRLTEESFLMPGCRRRQRRCNAGPETGSGRRNRKGK